MLRLVPFLTVGLMIGPVVAGFGGTLLPALGLTALTDETMPFSALLAWPGLAAAVRLSLFTGLVATGLALVITLLALAGWSGTRSFAVLTRLLSPMLAVPHAAAALGIAFLIAPSGWIVRAISPVLTGWERPPDLLILQDPWGISMTLALVAKEVPFLLLMALAALPQTRPDQSLAVARSLGYRRVTGWAKTVLPQLYPRIRLPVYAVLAYSMSVVDVAIILGPNTPPPLAVQITRWMTDPDLSLRGVAAAGALLQFGLVAGVLVLWRLCEELAARLGQSLIRRGTRKRGDSALRFLGLATSAICFALIAGGLAGLAVWSLAARWTFPSPLPAAFTLSGWTALAPAFRDPVWATLTVGVATLVIALPLVLLSLEAGSRRPLRRWPEWILYLPLLVPQITFLPGLQVLFLNLGLAQGAGPVVLAHLTFVLPYLFLSLAGPFRAWDTRFARAGAALGAPPLRVFLTLRLPMLLAPVLAAAALGFAVSASQYLPTLLMGGGRVQTLTTEAVAMASGGDRRAIGVFSVALTLGVALAFALALAVPRAVWINRRAMRGGQ